MEFQKGNIVLLKRPLADFICVVQWVEGETVAIRYMDSPHDASYNVVTKDDIIPLAQEQEKGLPEDFLEAINKQREVIFTPKKKKKVEEIEEKWKNLPPEAIAEILKIAEEDEGGN